MTVDLLATVPPCTGASIRAARMAAGLSQQQACDLVGLARRDHWSRMEADSTPMDPARWSLFLLAVGQHPSFLAVAR